MLRVAVVATGFVITSGLSHGSQSDIQTTPPTSALGSGISIQIPGENDWQLYKNDSIGFEVKCPKTWRISSEEPYGELVSFDPPQNEQRFSGFSVGPAQPIRDSWFRDFNRWIRDFKRAMTAAGHTILSEESMTISGYPAVRVIYKDNFPGTISPTVIDIFIGVSRQSDGEVFQFGYAPAKSPQYQHEQDTLYQRIISSLRISSER